MTGLSVLEFLELLLVALVVAIVIYAAYSVLWRREVREYNVGALLGRAHGYYAVLAGVVGAFGFVYRHWKAAPAGSPEKIGWSVLLCVLVGYLVFSVVRTLDSCLNGSSSREGSQAYSGPPWPEP